MNRKVINVMNHVCQCDENCMVVEQNSSGLCIFCNMLESDEVIEQINKNLDEIPIEASVVNPRTLCFKKCGDDL